MGFHWQGPNVAKIKHHSLTGRITLPLMQLAFRNVRWNRGVAGIDRDSNSTSMATAACAMPTTSNYFATSFSDVGDRFRGLDRWIRLRLRCMKYKRKRRSDNGRFRLVYFRRLGLCSLSELRPAPV